MTAEGRRFALIDALERLAGKNETGAFDPQHRDSAALARLRRGLNHPPGTCSEMLPYVVPFLPEQGAHEIYLLVASLFALHPPTDSRPGLSIGAAIYAVWKARGEIESIEKRFVALLNAHGDDLPHHLRQIIGLIKAQQNPVPLDYRSLLKHLFNWNAPDRWVQMCWARDFWGHKAVAEENNKEDPQSMAHEAA